MESKESLGHREVMDFLGNLQHPKKSEIEEIRKIILNANAQLTEHIKWNAPSFCIEGEDCITMKLLSAQKYSNHIPSRGKS